MQRIVTHLWFDKEAKAAAEFYVATFGGDSRMDSVRTLEGTPSGSVDIVDFQVLNHHVQAISAGPYFKISPAISFMVNFDSVQDPDAVARIDQVWAALAEGGRILMPIDRYSWSERYGWVEDKYGMSWQLILTKPEGEERPFILPSLLFVNQRYGQAEAAADFYLSVFQPSKLGMRVKYGVGQEPNKEGTVMFSDFQLLGTWMTAMDGSGEHAFDFGEAVSFVVSCETQEEIDYYWNKLSAVPESEQCGWLKDKYGVSWQIVPAAIERMTREGNPEQVQRVTAAFLSMKKFDIAVLEAIYRG